MSAFFRFVFTLKTILFFALVFFSLALIVRTFIVEIGVVDGRSMEDTYVDSEPFFVYKLPLLFRTPERGDVVQLIYKPTEQVLVKRIIGLPGEQIRIQRNTVYLIEEDGTETELEEPYLSPNTLTRTPYGYPITYGPFGEHEYFVLGDNRPQSSADSRLLGPIPREWIRGTAGSPIRLGR